MSGLATISKDSFNSFEYSTRLTRTILFFAHARQKRNRETTKCILAECSNVSRRSVDSVQRALSTFARKVDDGTDPFYACLNNYAVGNVENRTHNPRHFSTLVHARTDILRLNGEVTRLRWLPPKIALDAVELDHDQRRGAPLSERRHTLCA